MLLPKLLLITQFVSMRGNVLHIDERTFPAGKNLNRLKVKIQLPRLEFGVYYMKHGKLKDSKSPEKNGHCIKAKKRMILAVILHFREVEK